MSSDPAASARPTSAARNLIGTGPEAQRRESGRGRRFIRRSMLRVLRPYGAYQRQVDENIVKAIDDLDQRLLEQQRMQPAALAEDMLEALDSMRARLRDLEATVNAGRARPFAAPGFLDSFEVPVAGKVLGYRDRGDDAAAGYAGFEDVFRGPEDRVKERQRVYIELLKGHAPVLDAGCGRGEMLELLAEQGVAYAGVDLDPGMVERCRAKGHDVSEGTANDYLTGVADGGLGAIFSAQVIEHIPYPDLVRFLELSLAKLEPGGIFIAETVNPHAPQALKNFWVDPTHQHPLFPEVVVVLCRLAGFSSAYAFHPLGTGLIDEDRYRESEYAVVAYK